MLDNCEGVLVNFVFGEIFIGQELFDVDEDQDVFFGQQFVLVDELFEVDQNDGIGLEDVFVGQHSRVGAEVEQLQD